jgi:hypothetical protein
MYRRLRHHPASREAASFNKDKQQEQSFFSEASHDPFFKPVNGLTARPVVQLKASGPVKESVLVNKMEDKKEEEKKVQRKSEEEKDKMQKKAQNPEEEDKFQEKEDSKVQRKESGSTSQISPGNYIKSLNGKGKPLPADANALFSTGFGYDFSDVKVHTGKEAAGSAKAMNAKAYTIGKNIVFNEGQLNTDTAEGKKLMAHELTHVVQQNSDNKLRRKIIPEEAEKEKVRVPTLFERGIIEQNTRHKGNCNGVSVEGYTDANYGNSFTAPGSSTPVSDCPDCSSDECVVNNGTVVSVFTTNPQITLPSVPSGLNECEHNAVQSFINTTLRAHEQQHVAAFNTYRGRVRTPYTYRGCAGGLDAYLQQIHDRIETARKANSDAASAALDAGGANIFTVNCDCPDPEPDSGDE